MSITFTHGEKLFENRYFMIQIIEVIDDPGSMEVSVVEKRNRGYGVPKIGLAVPKTNIK